MGRAVSATVTYTGTHLLTLVAPVVDLDHLHLEQQPRPADGGKGTRHLLCELRLLPRIRGATWDSPSSSGFSGAVQKLGLTGFKAKTVPQTTKGFKYISVKLQGEGPLETLAEAAKEKPAQNTGSHRKGKGLTGRLPHAHSSSSDRAGGGRCPTPPPQHSRGCAQQPRRSPSCSLLLKINFQQGAVRHACNPSY